METILDKIVHHKRVEVAGNKQLTPVKQLERSDSFSRNCVSMKSHILRSDLNGIIAEFKRKSPSKGVINGTASVIETTGGYVQSGVSGLSILTDNQFFGGSNNDLEMARRNTSHPILRKDFIIDEYQIVEAKSIGADVILLIAAILSPAEISQLAKFAKCLGLEVLMEVHDSDELERSIDPNLDMIGVNNRNLNTFETNVEVSHQLYDLIPDEFVKVSESGISDPRVVLELKNCGYNGFLMGENFMKSENPGMACDQFSNELRLLGKQSV